MSSPRLIFHPSQPETVIPHQLLLEGLGELGFVSRPLEERAGESYAVGERFLELLTFLGCSPVINLSAADGDKYCYLELLQYDAPRLIYGGQPFQPRCKACKQNLPDWQSQLQQQAIECLSCGKRMTLAEVNWRQSAGFASQFIIVHNIYLHEAVPGEKLMTTLQHLSSGTSWDYFYAL
jgi:hypothetical protein